MSKFYTIYTLEEFKEDLNETIVFVENEIQQRKKRNDTKYVDIIESDILSELKMLLDYAEKGIIFFYERERINLGCMYCCVDILPFDDVVSHKISWLFGRYKTLNEHSGGKIYYQYQDKRRKKPLIRKKMEEGKLSPGLRVFRPLILSKLKKKK